MIHGKQKYHLWLLSFLGLLILYLVPNNFTQEMPSRKDGKAVIRVPVNVVIVKATVLDKEGNPVTDLTSNDFKLYDDGELQNIQTFALENSKSSTTEESELPDFEKDPSVTGGDEELPRMISILIDDLTMSSILEFPRLIDDIEEFIKKDMGPTDRIALLSASRNVQFPFSDNKKLILKTLDAVPGKLNLGWIFRATDPKLTDYAAWLISNTWTGNGSPEGEWMRIAALRQNGETVFQTRNMLYTIRQHFRALRHFEGHKTFILFSDGFIAEPGTAESYQLDELVELALRYGIEMNCVSIRHISADLAEIFPTGSGNSISNTPNGSVMDKMVQEDRLEKLASETGGQFYPGSNNLYKGLRDVYHQGSSYYVLTYPMPPREDDASYHKIRLEVTRPGLKLYYRKGYYSPKEESIFENRKKEDLIAALNGPGDMDEIPMRLSYNYSIEDTYTYTASFMTNVDIRGLQFLREDDRYKNNISLYLVVFDEKDRYISGLEKSIDFRLRENNYDVLQKQGLKSRVEFKLPVGRYKIKAVVREGNQGKMGSINRAMEIP